MESYPALPFRDRVVFPATVVHLVVGRAASVAAVDAALAADQLLVVVAQRHADTDEPTAGEVYGVGTLVRVGSSTPREDGHFTVELKGLERVRIARIDETGAYWRATVERIETTSGPEEGPLVERLKALVDDPARAALIDSGTRALLHVHLERGAEPAAEELAGWLALPVAEKQELLETPSVVERLTRIADVVERATDPPFRRPVPENAPSERMEFARFLAANGQHAAALDEFVWCFDYGLEHDPAFFGVRVSFLLLYWSELAKEFSPARLALEERRERAESALLSGRATEADAAAYLSLNRELGDDERSLGTYDELRGRDVYDAAILSQMFRHLLDALLAARRYREIVDGVGDVESEARRVLADYDEQRAFLTADPAMSEYLPRVLPHLRRSSVEAACRYVEAAAGVGEVEAARRLIDHVLASDTSAGTHVAIARAVARAESRDLASDVLARATNDLWGEDLEQVREALRRVLDS